MILFLVNLLLAVAWAAVTGSFGALNLLFGFLVGALVLGLMREQVPAGNYFGRLTRIASLGGLFLVELVKSAVKVAVTVMSPRLEVRPGIIAFPLTVDRDFEIALLANLITLTPGTLSVDVSADRKTLYVHCIDVPDPEAVVADIRSGFERKILEAFR